MENKFPTVMMERPESFGKNLDFDKKEKRIRLSKIVLAGLFFTLDFGVISHTKGEVGNPLDVLVLYECGMFPVCLVDSRIIGAIQCEQTERDGRTMRNDRMFSATDVSQLFSGFKELQEGIAGDYFKLVGTLL